MADFMKAWLRLDMWFHQCLTQAVIQKLALELYSHSCFTNNGCINATCQNIHHHYQKNHICIHHQIWGKMWTCLSSLMGCGSLLKSQRQLLHAEIEVVMYVRCFSLNFKYILWRNNHLCLWNVICQIKMSSKLQLFHYVGLLWRSPDWTLLIACLFWSTWSL